jgi:hypothetical protein
MYTAAHMMKSEQTTAMVAARLFSVEFWNDESLAKKSDRFCELLLMSPPGSVFLVGCH